MTLDVTKAKGELELAPVHDLLVEKFCARPLLGVAIIDENETVVFTFGYNINVAQFFQLDLGGEFAGIELREW